MPEEVVRPVARRARVRREPGVGARGPRRGGADEQDQDRGEDREAPQDSVPSVDGRNGVLRCLAIFSAILVLLVCAAPARPASAHSRFTPNPRAARYWTHHFFGHGWQAPLMLCVAYRESRYELSPPPSGYWGPWQILVTSTIHSWVNTYRITRSWRYAAAVAWRISDHGTYFKPWHPDCGA